MDKYYYGAYKKGQNYIIITAAYKTYNNAWKNFKKRDKEIRKKYRMWHLNNLYGYWYGVLTMTKFIEVDDYPFGMVELKGA